MQDCYNQSNSSLEAIIIIIRNAFFFFYLISTKQQSVFQQTSPYNNYTYFCFLNRKKKSFRAIVRTTV